MKPITGCIYIMALLALSGCKQKPQQAPGVFVEIALKNETDIDKYVVF